MSHKGTVLVLTGVGLGMLTLGFSSKIIYDAFCNITGYGGTPSLAEENLSEVIDRPITVKFDSNVAQGLPFEFKAEDKSLTLKLGESGLAYYSLKNTSSAPITGVANFNVMPIKAAPYFVKTDCFCFEEQTLQPGQELPLPVLFFVDSQMNDEARLDDVREVTLSYTFFEVDKPKKQAASRINTVADTKQTN